MKLKFKHELSLEDKARFQGVALSTESTTSISRVGLLKGDSGTAAAMIKVIKGVHVLSCWELGTLQGSVASI